MRWVGQISGPIKHWVSNAQKFLKKKSWNILRKRKKSSYICTPKTGYVLGKSVESPGFIGPEFFLEKKPSRDCGIWKRVLYLHPLWAERADWKRIGKFTDILNWQRRDSPETVFPNKENKPFWVPWTIISLVVKTLAVARPPEDLTMKSLILAQDER